MRWKNKLFSTFIVFSLCATAVLPLTAGRAEPASTLTPGDIRGFHLVSPDEGWLLLGEDLYWTADGGSAWQSITPPAPAGASIGAVAFLDAQTGWAVLISADETGFPLYQLAQTTDRGATWQIFNLPLFDPGDVSALAQRIYLNFIDPGVGWLVVKQASGGSFSLGALFKTLDGGSTWTRLSIPIGEPVSFINNDVGWTAGGAAGNELYRTQDGGLTWSAQTLPGTAGAKRLYRLPSFKNTQEGILPVVTNTATGSQVDFYATQDGGQTWEPAASAVLGQPLAVGAAPALSMLDGSGWVLVDEDSQQVLRSENGVQTILASSLAAGRITRLDMAAPDVGWAQTASGDCPTPDKGRKPQPASGAVDALACSSQAGLLQTTDGGQTWTPLTLPGLPGGASPQSNTPPVTGQGWDTCDIPSRSRMQTWMTSSPYHIWNLYIGGSRLADCGNLTAAYISQLTGQGWKFIPTWVGPQAPCWNNSASDMGYDPPTAYIQGINEANAAVERAANLLLTKPDKTGTIIYYDLEAYNTANIPCRNAVKSFMAGWTAQLHARGNQAAVYGSGCYGALSDFVTNPQVPDAIWAAEWTWPYRYRSDATVWDVGCLPNSLWSSHQRLHQYAGAHDETWGGVTMNVDSNVADGIVVDLSTGPQIRITAPADNAWLPTGLVQVTAAPLDANVTISRVEFQWHSANWAGSGWVPLGTDANGSDGWGILFDTSGVLPEGQGGAIYAWAYDSSDNRSGAGVWNLGIDHTPPAVSVWTAPMYGDSPFRDFHVRWSGSDNLPGTIRFDIQYQVDSTSGSWINLVNATTDTEYRFVGQYEHTYYFRGRGLDAYNNLSAYTSPVSFTVGSQPISHPDAYEVDNTPAEASILAVDGPAQAHNFDVEGDQDWIKFEAASRTPYILQTSNTGGHADTMLFLYGTDGTTLLEVNDDYPGLNLASRIDWRSSDGGTYYIKVVHWDPYAAGDTTAYTLSVVHAHLTFMPVISR